MEVLKRNKKITLILLIIAIILAISVVFFVQNISKPPSTLNPSSTPMSSPSPIKNTPTPTSSATSTPTSTPITSTPTLSSQPTPIASLFPGEVIQYQGQNLTPVSVYIDYLIQHPDVAIAGTQNINKATYHLAITGLVNNTVNYTYDEVVNNFNSTLQVATLPCVEGWSVTMLWQGVPVTDLLQQADVGSNATTLIFLAADGYSTSLPLDYVKQNNIMIAYKINNVTLTPQTGWPFFLVAKNQYGYKWIEWLTEINVSNDTNYLGYWESRGYPNNATVIDPKNATQPLISVPIILPVIAISIACVAITMAVFVSRRKEKKKQKLTRMRRVKKILYTKLDLSSRSMTGHKGFG
jgi:DMSO/TMAO reductase YedYZ molybdopterin-dependent catalytic subunit